MNDFTILKGCIINLGNITSINEMKDGSALIWYVSGKYERYYGEKNKVVNHYSGYKDLANIIQLKFISKRYNEK